MMTNYDDLEARKQFAEVVAAWAAGAKIQYRRNDDEAAWQDQSHPFCIYDLSWRVKPQTIRYRVALMLRIDGDYDVRIDIDESDAEYRQCDHYFIRWLTDWQEVEV
jgi:hypothetical protein